MTSVLAESQDPRVMRHLARMCSDAGVRLWVGESTVPDVYMRLTHALSSMAQPPDVGIAVNVITLRNPVQMAAAILSLQELTRCSLHVGFGSGPIHPGMPRPSGGWAQAVTQYAAQTRDAYQDMIESRPGSAREPSAPAWGCGVLRERMAHDAAAWADFLVTWLSTPQDIARRLAPSAATGASTASADPPSVRAIVPFGPAAPHSVDVLHLAAQGIGRHLGAPHYRAALQKRGVSLTGDFAQDLRTAVRKGYFPAGGAEEMRSVAADYVRAGCREVIFNMGAAERHFGPKAYLRAVEEQLEMHASDRRKKDE